MAPPEFRNIRLERRNGVAHVVLARPDKLNALAFGPGSNRAEIAAALQWADADPDTGAILIRAEGRSFCAGGDLTGLEAFAGARQDEFLIAEVDRFHAAVRQTQKPTIAAVHGACLGAGLGFIAQCDFVLASDDATFGLPEGRFGHPGGSELVPLIGQAWAKFLIFTGERLDARRAADIGLVLLVLERGQLESGAADLAERIARMPEDAVRLNKAAIDKAGEAGGRSVARVAGRSGDLVTKSMSRHAKAPDGRLFEEILKAEGPQGLKQAQQQQYTQSWVEKYVSRT
ncbi:enoyl-CoA hydratase/isomerase family protein [uncultured Azohydromonas sp.]|jgi:Enoyl-CoA hydratase/carnithine racemase|uniref:enoyl-CoA hydratase/isomerase family protein n=1 Tax=uncultured Azohydromonas sp. TaxID=487342 RepID=UPI002625E0AA|nr:enoyl-CoA hydratase/isomerase family protein [uncultured Azohydromonas sp.]